MQRHRHWLEMLRVVLLMLCVLGQPTLASADEKVDGSAWKTDEENWYIVEFGGGRAGWYAATIQSNGGQIRTTTHTHMKISRMNVAVPIDIKTTFTETLDGKPVQIDIEGKTSQQPTQ